MLVLSRHEGEEVVIGDNIRVVVYRIAGNRIVIGIDAPQDTPIRRGELQAKLDNERGEERKRA